MSNAAPQRRVVVVEARDLESDERTRASVEVEQPSAAAEQREQLRAVVGALHPTARLRTFADEAASFLDTDHLIVAHYGELVEVEAPRPSPPLSLFAT